MRLRWSITISGSAAAATATAAAAATSAGDVRHFRIVCHSVNVRHVEVHYYVSRGQQPGRDHAPLAFASFPSLVCVQLGYDLGQGEVFDYDAMTIGL